MRHARIWLPVAALAALSAGCAPSYKALGPMSFQDVRYDSVSGVSWPEHRLRLPRIEQMYHLPKPLVVHYVERNPGGGQTVLFIHGLGSNLKFWRYQLDEFAAKGYHVIALDLPGFGKSDKPASFPYTMEAMADVVRELARATKADRPILVGHSMGGQTALSFAIRYPGELRALVLVSPAGFEEFSPNEKEWLRKVFSVRLVKRTTEYGVWGAVRRNNFARWRPEYEWLIEERVRVAQSEEFDAYAYANVKAVGGLSNNDFVRQRLGDIQVPTLIVYGDRDALIPNPFLHGGRTAAIMEYGHERIQGSKLVELAGCGHTVQMDCAPEYNATVLRYLAGLGPAPERD